MTIIVFLIDTSASMNQRAYLGGRPTLLDVAKGAVETFVKVRQRVPESRGDRYMLLSFEDPPLNVKAAWKENLATFMNELKNLRCNGMTTMGAALKHAFDVLNINRMQTGIDTYGQGRCPFYLEPAVIVVITDGGKLTNSTGVQEEFNLPMHSPIPGCELTREPFRWDQRLFSLVLRLSGTPTSENAGLVPNDTSPIDAMCEVTGGRSYCITSHRMLHQCIDSLVQKVQSGVVINFEKFGPDPPQIHERNSLDSKEIDDAEPLFKDWERPEIHQQPQPPELKNGTTGRNQVMLNSNGQGTVQPWHSCRKLIYVPRSAQKGFPVGFWPIPESFWPDLQNQTLPPRSAHPNVKFSCISQDPMVIESLPFDKYELEPSPLTQYILARKQPSVCWQVFVPNSYKNSDMGHPFGYLKASTNLTCVNLFVMPYNYPVLLPLLDELFKVHRQKQTPEWRASFSNYLKTMPPYYALPLRRALSRMGIPANIAQSLVPETMDNCLSFSVVNHLKKLKNQAKQEYERMCNEVSSKQQQIKLSQQSDGVRVVLKTHLKQKELVTHPLLRDKFSSLRDQLEEYGAFVVGIRSRGRGCQSFKNAYDIPRKQLLDQVLKMRTNFLQTSALNTRLIDQDVLHSMPISQMGNYQEYLKKSVPALKEIESTPVRQHMFGNPFKIDKRMMMVDEADIDLVGGGGSRTNSAGGGTKRGYASVLDGGGGAGPGRPQKRKPGPIPRDVVVRRPSTPSITPPCSPSPPSPFPLSPVPSPIPVNCDFNNEIVDEEKEEMEVPLLHVSDSLAPPIPLQNSFIKSLVNGDVDEERRRWPSPEPSCGSGPPVLQPYDTLEEDKADTEEPPRLTPVALPASIPPLLPVLAPLDQIEDKPPPDLHPADLRKHNLQVRAAAYREVRRPGLNYKPLMDHLERLQGPMDIKIKTVKDVINESLRFKRRILACQLDKRLKQMIQEAATNSPGTNGER